MPTWFLFHYYGIRFGFVSYSTYCMHTLEIVAKRLNIEMQKTKLWLYNGIMLLSSSMTLQVRTITWVQVYGSILNYITKCHTTKGSLGFGLYREPFRSYGSKRGFKKKFVWTIYLRKCGSNSLTLYHRVSYHERKTGVDLGGDYLNHL